MAVGGIDWPGPAGTMPRPELGTSTAESHHIRDMSTNGSPDLAEARTLEAALARGWICLEDLLTLASGSPVDADEAVDLARAAGFDVVEQHGDAWDDLQVLADEGPDAFRQQPERPASAEELAADDPGTFYLREISRTPLLTADEEVQLAQRLELGTSARRRLDTEDVPADERDELEETVRRGEAARQRLIESNLRLVVSIAKKYLGRGVSFLDLVQEGNIGLQKGVDKYEWRKGFRFSTYAYWWIRQAVTRAVAEHGRTIRLPGHVFELLSKLYNTARQLHDQLGRAPTMDEIAQPMGVSPEKVREAFRAARIPISLEKPIGDDATSTLGDLVADIAATPPEQEAEDTLLATQLDRALHEHLDPRQVRLVKLRFGLDRGGFERTLGEVGKELGMSRERVRQLESQSLAKLREAQGFRREFRDFVM